MKKLTTLLVFGILTGFNFAKAADVYQCSTPSGNRKWKIVFSDRSVRIEKDPRVGPKVEIVTRIEDGPTRRKVTDWTCRSPFYEIRSYDGQSLFEIINRRNSDSWFLEVFATQG